MIMDCIRKFGGSQTLEAIKLRSVIVAHNNACETVNGIVIGGWYRHFKGAFAKVLCLARHSETNDYLVIYECMGNGKSDSGNKDGIYARPIKMFLSPVDKRKYPDANQKFRFELITESNCVIDTERGLL